MASHRRRVRRFSRKTTAKVALLRGLVNSLVEHGRIKTTLAKAKETKRHVEKAITVAKRGNLSSRRLLLSRYPNEAAVSKLMDVMAGQYKDRNGGYTRIIKLGARPGDSSPMAFIEFVDYKFDAATPDTEPTAKKAKKVVAKKKAASAAKKAVAPKKAKATKAASATA
ncbi:MAG: 50S ribosomal protein L17 [Pseudobdellovibrionaceae bacterium]